MVGTYLLFGILGLMAWNIFSSIENNEKIILDPEKVKTNGSGFQAVVSQEEINDSFREFHNKFNSNYTD